MAKDLEILSAEKTTMVTNGNCKNEQSGQFSLRTTMEAVYHIRRIFGDILCEKLNLKRICGPLFVEISTGLNDDLSGHERCIDFITKNGSECAIVHSLAKWKRFILNKLEVPVGEGIVTDMNAIRRDEILSPIHSYYVDQWDYELVINDEQRTMNFLKRVVRRIYEVLKETEIMLCEKYKELRRTLVDDINFVSSQQLENDYPELTPKERELEICKKYGSVFISGIGGKLKSGNVHDLRAPDYDDWELNGDIIVYYKELDIPLELSSMGIRVNKQKLEEQLKLSGCEHKREMMFQQMLLNNQLPLTLGGGIGQSRIAMYLLKKKHIGQVQPSVWDNDVRTQYKNEHDIELL
ncbi:hypothetical protein SNEBB_010658 [Seison nebaliae]|nr:hypothetical protein SNEBB_010658 [Seison nebaliae]